MLFYNTESKHIFHLVFSLCITFDSQLCSFFSLYCFCLRFFAEMLRFSSYQSTPNYGLCYLLGKVTEKNKFIFDEVQTQISKGGTN